LDFEHFEVGFSVIVNVCFSNFICRLLRVVKFFFRWKGLVVAGFKKWCCGNLCDLICDIAEAYAQQFIFCFGKTMA
jgi:hypothetical protein